jgi:predicted MPP superfamily phosphohydrolase
VTKYNTPTKDKARVSKNIIIFIVIILGFIFLANFVVYKVLEIIFIITTPTQLLLLATMLGVFSGSFIVATILGNYFYNWFTRLYYKIFAIWMGFFCYLFFACIIYVITIYISKQSFNIIGVFLICIALLASLYGIIHSRKIFITKIQIKIPNLPSSWKNRKAVWISDLHLGQLLGPSFAEKIVDKINILSPDIVFIGGDLFDGTQAPSMSELIAPLSKIIAPLGTYFITGNHEELGNSDKFISAIKSIGIRTLLDEMTDINGLQLIGVDYRKTSNRERFQKIISDFSIDIQKPSILLKHEPKDLDIAEKAGISLQISGHTHQAQMWPLSYIAQFVYGGYSYGLKKFGSMQIYTSSGTGTWGPPMRIGTNSEIVLMEF